MLEIKEEKIKSPSYYQQFKDKIGVDVHIISEALGFYLGNVFKYIARAGYKSEQGYSQNQKKLEDLYKAKEYLDFEIDKIKKENNNEQLFKYLFSKEAEFKRLSFVIYVF